MTSEIRVRLKADFSDEFGQQFTAGQTGTRHSSAGDLVVVDFDGYEAERRADAERKAKFGEGLNIVPWAAAVPVELLELAP